MKTMQEATDRADYVDDVFSSPDHFRCITL